MISYVCCVELLIREMRITYVVSLLVIMSPFMLRALNITCKVSSNPVDWMLAYKFPLGETTAFMSPEKEWTESDMGDTSPIGETLAQFMNLSSFSSLSTLPPLFSTQAKDGVGVIAYNKHPPKLIAAQQPGCGFLLVPDEATGIWVVHTLPQFPDFTQERYTKPKPNQMTKAGMFVCVTIPKKFFRDAVELLTYEAPMVYFFNKPVSSNRNWPGTEAERLENGDGVQYTPYVKSAILTSQGTTLRAFAKMGRAELDIYSRYIAPTVKRSIRVWGQGEVRYVLPNYCNAVHKVEMLRGEFKLNSKTIVHYEDSATWLISKGYRLWCISNSPRLHTYERLGAGVLCLENQKVHGAFAKLAKQTKSPQCPT